MKIQFIVYDPNNTISELDTSITVSSFTSANAFDAFDLNIISFQNPNVWKNRPASYSSVQSSKDINTLSEMCHAARNTRILILLPGNYLFNIDYGYELGSSTPTYQKSSQLKDVIKDFHDSPLKPIFPYPAPIVFGISQTKIEANNLSADFSFLDEGSSEHRILLSSNAGTITAMQTIDGIVATTLTPKTNSQLFSLVNALFPEEDIEEEYPGWLDDIHIFDEDELRERLALIQSEVERLKEEATAIENSLAKYKDTKSILSSKDFILEEKVTNLLKEILDQKEEFVDKKEEDYRYEDDSLILLFEVKGSVGGLKRSHVSKTYDHVQIAMDELEEAGDGRQVRGTLIFASQINTPPSKRDKFPEKQVSIASKNDVVIISVETFLKCYEAVIQKRLTKAAFIKTIQQKTGLLEIADFEFSERIAGEA